VIIEQASTIGQSYLVDGEAVGEQLFVFDLLEMDKTDIREQPYSERISRLEELDLDEPIVIVGVAKTTSQKQELYDNLQAAGAEGIVFKKQNAPYTAGRPNSGGTQMKFKFYATASVIVIQINDKRSVGVAVVDDGEQVPVGNVTIPANKEIPTLNALVEVRYLYAYPNGSLYQPTYLGVRDDISAADCAITQLKYKQS